MKATGGVSFLTGAARVAGIMGWPVRHSLSPLIHGHWIRRHGIDAAYIPFPVPPTGLAAALRALPSLGVAGCNLTVPHKIEALALLDRVSPAAEAVGAVNTVFVRGGMLEGDNTDGAGFTAGLREQAPGWAAGDGPLVVLGAGGAARAVVAALRAESGAEIVVVNRTRRRAEGLSARFPPAFPAAWDALPGLLADAALLVNTTVLGMEGAPPLEVDLAPLSDRAVVADIVYAPGRTGILRAAEARGLAAVDGLSMLLHQAVPGFEGWFGIRPEVDGELRRLVREALAAR